MGTWILLVVIAAFSGIIAGMGIGGGSIFILLTTIFSIFEHKEAQSYNLIMFVVVGLFATISNFKNKNIDKDLLKKLIIPVVIGSIIGIILVKRIDEKILTYIFYGFMLLIGFYEIISSLKSRKKGKINTERSD
ncbi:MAG: TSUP family transporter [Clostridia bacterium]|nr:TSUP family transporter [Clostridia bacterium]